MEKDNYILIENVSETEVRTILNNLSLLYADTGFVNEIELYNTGKGFLVTFPFNPDFERFQYFVNYIHYPENISTKPKVKGYWTISLDDNTQIDETGKKLLLYVSKNDKEYDNVSVVTEDNRSFLFDFGGKVIDLDNCELTFEKPEVDINKYEKLKNIVLDPEKIKAAKKNNSGCSLSFIGIGVIIVTSVVYIFS